ncbi:hypothetical protein RRG08_032518 [Elysia crispata]|uniref:Uncharacterized protein n=1 Tax=Elysia crispata TaxID=231223 RepID=A0AAE0ZXS1_9GAST|nr:hypothetical protein RRG08_032518 [Elysia crispata]
MTFLGNIISSKIQAIIKDCSNGFRRIKIIEREARPAELSCKFKRRMMHSVMLWTNRHYVASEARLAGAQGSAQSLSNHNAHCSEPHVNIKDGKV